MCLRVLSRGIAERLLIDIDCSFGSSCFCFLCEELERGAELIDELWRDLFAVIIDGEWRAKPNGNKQKGKCVYYAMKLLKIGNLV